MFKKILFPTSATKACDHAARVAFNISNQYNAHLNILHVMEAPRLDDSLQVTDEKAKENIGIDDKDVARIKAEVTTCYAEQLSKVKSYEIRTSGGHLQREILKEIQNNKPDLVVMGGSSEKEGSSKNKIESIGSTLQKVAKASDCPLLIVNRVAASFWGSITNAVFATDFSKSSDAAFEFACKLARNTGCELHIFHAQQTRLAPGSDIYSQNAIEERISEKLRFYRKKYIPKMEGIDHYSIEVWEGTPYMEIVKYARDKYADLIIMAHDSKSPGTDSEEFGSNVEQVILRAGCPVLCINK
jgi:nucleotide-binding universal stress UspA family protein